MKLFVLLRALWRTLRIAVLTLCGFSATIFGHLLRRPAPGVSLALRNRAFRWWGRSMVRAFGGRIRVEGTPPTGPCVLVTNHVSYIDIPLVGSQVDAAFVGKADLRHWPVAGLVMAAADTIFIDRSRKRDLLRVLEQVDQAMDRGLSVVFFPEGTSGKGDAILPLKPSLLQLAVARGLPVHWATITYRTPSGGPPPSNAVCWWGDEPLAPHYRRIMALPWFEATLHFGERPIEAADRKELAARLYEALDDSLEPMD